MATRVCTTALLLASAFTANAQCSITFPTDTVNLYWGYDPLACATLAPTLNGAPPASVVWSNGATTPTLTVCDTLSAWYMAALVDDTLCTAIDSVFINVVDVRCGNNNKVLVCHIPPGNPANAHTICISENGVPAHLAHGCVLGPCTLGNDSIGGGGGLQIIVMPNPVADQAMVQVSSSVAQRVRITVVDALGRRSGALLDATMQAGEQRTLLLDPALLPQGTTAIWLEAQGGDDRIVHRSLIMR